MQDPYLLDIRSRYPDAAVTKRTPFRRSRQLAYAQHPGADTCWQHRDFSLAHQVHDGRHVYVSVLEADVQTDHIRLPIKGLYTDLHYLYVLDGTATIETPDHHRPPILLRANTYLLGYLGRDQTGIIALPNGRNLLAAFTVERGWLRRRPAVTTRQLPPYRMDVLTAVLVSGLLELPALPGLGMDLAIDACAIRLIARHQLLMHPAQPSVTPHTDPLTEAVKQGIAQDIEAERYPNVDLLAETIGCSRKTLLRHFRKAEGCSIQEYLIARLMARAMYLLQHEGLSPSATAFRLGYTEPASFNHQFKQYHGITPSATGRSGTVPN